MALNGSLTSLTQPHHTPLFEQMVSFMAQSFTSSLSMLVDSTIQVKPSAVEEVANLEELNDKLPAPRSIVTITRFMGGANLPTGFIMDEASAKAIGNHLMGGGSEDSQEPISDIQLGAIGEIITQMMAATVSQLHSLTPQTIEILTPTSINFTVPEVFQQMPETAESALGLITYTISSNPVTHSECQIVQFIPINPLCDQLDAFNQAPNAANPTAAEFSELLGASPDPAGGGTASPFGGATMANPVTVQPINFPSFDSHISSSGAINQNLALLMDVNLNLTVELGRTELSIKDVLELTRGSVIELNRVAGEAVDLYANGKMIAKGEVVVIEDNFGLRITSILSPSDRLRGLSLEQQQQQV